MAGALLVKSAKMMAKKLGKTGKGKQVALGAVSASSASGPILEGRKRYKDHKRLKRTGVMSPAQEKRFKKKMGRTMKRQTKEWGQEERALKGKPKNIIERLRSKSYKNRRAGKKKQAEYWAKDTEKRYKKLEKWSAPIGGDTEAGRKSSKAGKMVKKTRSAIEQRKNIKGFVSTLKKTAKKKPEVKKKTKMRGKEPSLYFYTK